MAKAAVANPCTVKHPLLTTRSKVAGKKLLNAHWPLDLEMAFQTLANTEMRPYRRQN